MRLSSAAHEDRGRLGGADLNAARQSVAQFSVLDHDTARSLSLSSFLRLSLSAFLSLPRSLPLSGAMPRWSASALHGPLSTCVPLHARAAPQYRCRLIQQPPARPSPPHTLSLPLSLPLSLSVSVSVCLPLSLCASSGRACAPSSRPTPRSTQGAAGQRKEPGRSRTWDASRFRRLPAGERVASVAPPSHGFRIIIIIN